MGKVFSLADYQANTALKKIRRVLRLQQDMGVQGEETFKAPEHARMRAQALLIEAADCLKNSHEDDGRLSWIIEDCAEILLRRASGSNRKC